MRSTALGVLLCCLAATEPAAGAAPNPLVEIDTSLGRVVIEVLADRAPASAANFLAYVESGFYDGTIFHRVIPGFVIQGGGFDADMRQKRTRPPIANEADNGLENRRGTLSLARTPDPHSATSQFFINLSDNAMLDHSARTHRGWGYAVFGRVVEGMEVIERIAAVATGVLAGMPDVPLSPVVVQSARVRRAP